MGKHSVSIDEKTYEAMVKTLKYGQFQPFAQQAILEKLAKENPTDVKIKFYSDLEVFNEIKTIQDNLRKVIAFVNFYGSYADKNQSDMLMAMGNPDTETRDLITRLFDSGKQASEVVKPILLKLIDSQERIVKQGIGEEQKHSKEWYKERMKMETKQRELRAQRVREEMIAEMERKTDEQKREREKHELEEKIKRDPFYGLTKDQILYVTSYSKEAKVSLEEARKVVFGED